MWPEVPVNFTRAGSSRLLAAPLRGGDEVKMVVKGRLELPSCTYQVQVLAAIRHDQDGG